MIDVGLGSNPNAPTGAGVIGTGSDVWNHAGYSANSQSLFDSNGHSTGVSMSVVATGNVGGLGNVSPNTTLSSEYDYTLSDVTPITVSLTGLIPNEAYDLYAYSITDPCCGPQPGSAATRPGLISAALANGGASAPVTANPTLDTWVAGQNYVLLPVVADSSGDLTFTAARLNVNTEADLNGFQLIAVPEPSAWIALLGVAGMGLIGLVWRRRNAI